MILCPVCQGPSREKRENTPYHICSNCDLWFQEPLPPKIYEGKHERTEDNQHAGHLMSDHDKSINEHLARSLFDRWLKDKPTANVLDIGSKYPYLAACLKKGRPIPVSSFGIEGEDDAVSHGIELGVPLIAGDFEKLSVSEILAFTNTQGKHSKTPHKGYDLITLVHMFEHLYDPIASLRKLRELVTPDGHVFLRLPDHGVAGYERDLEPSHFLIHPYFYSLEAILELLVQTKDLFVVVAQEPMQGAGQHDIVLKPITRRPTIVAGLIQKNEERDLPKLLKSLVQHTRTIIISEGTRHETEEAPPVDGVVLIDTGSTDKSVEIAKELCEKNGIPIWTRVYTGASKKIDGEWKIESFAKARNEYCADAESIRFVIEENGKLVKAPSASAEMPIRSKYDWLLWVDADDVLLTPRQLRRASYLMNYQVFGVEYINGTQSFCHDRMWRTGLGIKYEGAVDEYPTHGGFHRLNLMTDAPRVKFRHDFTHVPGAETSNDRNLRIHQAEFKKNPNPRTAFYLAETHRWAGRTAEAVEFYKKRIAFGVGFREEWLFAHLYLARCQTILKLPEDARRTLMTALTEEPRWSEFWMELAHIAYAEQDWNVSIGFAYAAIRPILHSDLWREQNKYTDQPLRHISWCFEHQGNYAAALDYAQLAKEKIGAPDKDWDDRVERLGNIVADLRRGTAQFESQAGPASFSQNGQDTFLEKLFKGGSPGNFVDVGAYDGLLYSNTSLLEAKGWRGICVEPIPEVVDKLIANRPNAEIVCAAIAPKAGMRDFLHATSPTVPTELMSGLAESFDPRHLAVVEKEVADYNGKIETLRVRCLTLNQVLGSRGIKHVDLLCLDTEGNEYEILQSIWWKQFTFSVIVVEVNFEDQEQRMKDLLESKGFVYMEKLGHDLVFADKAFIQAQEFKQRTGEKTELVPEVLPPISKLIGPGWKPAPRIGLHRPGAIGDILMTLNLVPLLKQQNPDAEIHYFCNPGIGEALKGIMEQAGVHTVHPHTDWEKFQSCLAKSVNLVGYPLHEGYPDKPMKRHLLRYFADEMGLVLPATSPLPSLRLPRPPFKRLRAWTSGQPYITFQVKTGWSAYKNWDNKRWEGVFGVVSNLYKDLHIVQIGQEGESKIPGTLSALGLPLEDSIALIANARLHVGLDSFANHVTNFTWYNKQFPLNAKQTRGVILWGSTQVLGAGYPQNVNLSAGLPCQPCFREDPKMSAHPRGPCINPPGQVYEQPKHECMNLITVPMVVSAIRETLDSQTKKRRLPVASDEVAPVTSREGT